MNRQKLLLILLLGLFVLALAYAYRTTPRQSQVSEVDPRRPASTRPEAAAGRSVSAAEPRVQLELLVREDDASLGFKRNIFRFRQSATAPLPPPPVPTVALLPPPPPPTPPVAAARQNELARFTFLGFLLKDGVKSIFLSSNEEIFVVRKGDRFGNNKRFLVTELTPERLTIRQDYDPRPIIIPLVEQAPLVEAPSFSPPQEFPGRSGQTRPRRPLPPAPASEDLRPTEPVEPVEPTEPTEPTGQAEPAGPVQMPGYEAAPIKMLPLEQTTPPQDVAPQKDPR
jgi:hypothetical protein